MLNIRIYTKTGDRGETGLLGGVRVRKSDARVEAYGTVDELNACLGEAAAHVRVASVRRLLPAIQRTLFSIGAVLADARSRRSAPTLDDETLALEREIDACQKRLPPLRNFILPGGSPSGARLHVARTVCRRAERRIEALAAAHAAPPQIVRYVNRLSDLLFVWARAENRAARTSEIAWTPDPAADAKRERNR